MNHPARNARKTLCAVAENNEAAALEVMRAIDQIGDQLLRQRLLNVVHHLNQDAEELRGIRDGIQLPVIRRA